MKYIIELSEEPLSIFALSTIKGIPKATKIETFEPYIEPDRKAIEGEVWEFAKEVRLKEFIDEEGRLHGYISSFNSYSEAKAKYKAWLKEKDEIHVGDELKQIIAGGSSTGAKCIVVKIDGDKMNGIGEDGSLVVCSFQVKRWWTKTGRSFPEVAELLKKMGDEK